MAYNIINVVWDLVRGKLKFVNRSVAKERYSFCKSCEVRNPKLNICTACGCYLPAKTKLEKSSCPLGYW